MTLRRSSRSRPWRSKRPRGAVWVVAVLTLLLLAVVPRARRWVQAAPTPTPSAAVLPASEVPLAFSHAAHQARGATCTDCHAGATTSRSAIDWLLPGERACVRCHAQAVRAPGELGDVAERDPTRRAACATCHPSAASAGVIARARTSSPAIKFSHQAHVQTACTTCHPNVAQATAPGSRDLPSMATCLSCHPSPIGDPASVTAVNGCGRCHLVGAGARLETRLTHGRLVPQGQGALASPEAHDLAFLRDHSAAARSPSNTCAACHAPSECAACHAGVQRPTLIHPGDFAFNHGTLARQKGDSCSSCHRAQTFCLGCHERTGVGLRAGGAYDVPGNRFHGDDWVGDGTANSHGREARRALETCVSCHREETCTRCHSAEPGAPRISPHPPGWGQSVRCRAQERANVRSCLRCHVGGDATCDR